MERDDKARWLALCGRLVLYRRALEARRERARLQRELWLARKARKPQNVKAG